MAMTGAGQLGEIVSHAKNAYQTEPSESGLARIANQVSIASDRIEQIAAAVGQVSYSIHGPRPEPVSGANVIKGDAASDSLASRVSALLDAVDRLQRAYESIVR